jgi:hypothetical protein
LAAFSVFAIIRISPVVVVVNPKPGKKYAETSREKSGVKRGERGGKEFGVRRSGKREDNGGFQVSGFSVGASNRHPDT